MTWCRRQEEEGETRPSPSSAPPPPPPPPASVEVSSQVRKKKKTQQPVHFCNHCKIWLLSPRRRPCSAVYLFWKSDPGSVQNMSIVLLWLAVGALECVSLLFWLAAATARQCSCGALSLSLSGALPQEPAHHPCIRALNITEEKHKTDPGSKSLDVL